jgi:hypothetical protein
MPAHPVFILIRVVVTCQSNARSLHKPGLAFPAPAARELSMSFNLRLNVCDIDIYIFTNNSAAKSLLSTFPRHSDRPATSCQLRETLTHRLI